MSTETLHDKIGPPLSVPPVDSSSKLTIAYYEQKLHISQRGEARLRATLAAKRVRLRQQDARIEQQELLHKESCHRLLNGLQMVSSLLSLQSRAAAQVETATQLAAASRRIGVVTHIHRHLNGLDRTTTVSLNSFLNELCSDFSTILSADCAMSQPVVVEGIDIDLPAAVAGPLGLIASELITNAVKHGIGRITVELSRNSDAGYTLSVSNDGSMPMKDRVDAGRSGLGMTIIESLARQIGAKVSVDSCVGSGGMRVAVSFTRSTPGTQDRTVIRQ